MVLNFGTGFAHECLMRMSNHAYRHKREKRRILEEEEVGGNGGRAGRETDKSAQKQSTEGGVCVFERVRVGMEWGQ